MNWTGQSFVRLAFVVCLGITGGCASRSSSKGTLSAPSVAAAPPPAAPASPSPAPSLPPVTTNLPVDNSPTCGLISEDGEGVATVALGEPVDPGNAPNPTNSSERLLFRQLYETLVRVDCEGRVVPGLASSWRWDAERAGWLLTLRKDARFVDGTPVTAFDVVSGWTVSGVPEMLRPVPRRLVRSILAVDDATLVVELRSRRSDMPIALAHTDLAVARRQSGFAWPTGTRPARLSVETAGRSGAAVMKLTPVPKESAPLDASDNLAIRFVVAPGRDGRDFLDDGIDLLLTRDAQTLDYAATLPQFMAVPLPWQRTEVLLTPGRTRESSTLSMEARESLAREAVRGEARAAEGPFWWQAPANCDIDVSARPTGLRSSRTGSIVYDAADAAARDLAERLVGLVRVSGPGAAAILDALLPDRSKGTYQRATGLTGEALAAARRRGDDAGYIVAFDRPLDPCRELQVLRDEVGWVDPETISPLVDTRLQVIVRRGHSGVILEWDGGLLLMDGLQ